MDFKFDFRINSLDDIEAQSDIVDIFKLFISKNEIPHSIFFGPPGCGKTTFAKVLADSLSMDFFEFDGSSFKVDEVRKVINRYKETLLKPLIFIDEFHRLSKTQEEILLIPMEKKEIVIIGATTENPQFCISSGVRSRSMIFEFKALTNKDLEAILKRLEKKVEFSIEDSAKEYLISSSGGDVRAMLNLLNYSLLVSKDITLKTLKTLRANPNRGGVSSKDIHYNLASAMIKSLRGSDIDASLYYLARLIVGGESPEFIARRLVIFASEDIGNANPNALNLATNTMASVSKIGYPEARIILAQCAVYLASCPKSNSSYKAINSAIDYVKNSPELEIPKYLINSSKESKDYLYPHNFGGYVEQKYLEKELEFYKDSSIGFEKTLNDWIKKIKKDRK